MEVLVTQPVIVALAMLGALLSAAASFLQARGRVSEKTGRVLNWAGYGAMAASMLLFTLAGLLR